MINSDSAAMAAEHRANQAAMLAYAAANAAYKSKDKADILKAGDLFRYAAALYQQAADAWRARDQQPFAEHCNGMADRLSGSAFARCSLVATYHCAQIYP